jgi:hypothetical protein
MAALVLTNLVYVVGAVVVATLISGLYVFRHRKPKSLESGIESFSRELRALAPERRADDERAEVPGVRVQAAARSGAPGRRRPRGGVATADPRSPARTGLSAGSEAGRAAGVPDPDDGGAVTPGGQPG